MTDHTETPEKVPLRLLHICQPCLDGVGSECHTAGCSLFLHRVDLPVHKELYTTLEEDPIEQLTQARAALATAMEERDELQAELAAQNANRDAWRADYGLASQERDALRARNDALTKALEAAPHDILCNLNNRWETNQQCTCWKSRALGKEGL